jgi:hypothetical protein
MAATATRVYRDDMDVNRRLAELRLAREKLLAVRRAAVAAAADATDYHPANGAGTLSYQHGTFALRREHVDKEWSVDRSNGVEAIRHDGIKVKVAFANVDVACSDVFEPKPRSGKGAGAERLCAGNDLFGGLPTYASSEPSSGDKWTFFYLMVDPAGAVELTCATVKFGSFERFIERIFLSDGSDLKGEPEVSFDDGDGALNFDPAVNRKK